jgi:hypothetical protein
MSRSFYTAIRITSFIRDVSASVGSPIEAFDTGADYSTAFSTAPDYWIPAFSVPQQDIGDLRITPSERCRLCHGLRYGR